MVPLHVSIAITLIGESLDSLRITDHMLTCVNLLVFRTRAPSAMFPAKRNCSAVVAMFLGSSSEMVVNYISNDHDRVCSDRT